MGHLCILNNLLHLTLSNQFTKNQLTLNNRLLTSLTRSSQHLTSPSSPIMALFLLATHTQLPMSSPVTEHHRQATTLSLPATELHQATTLSLPAMEHHLAMNLIPPTHPTYNLLATAHQNQSTEACLGVEEVSPHSLHTMRLLMAMANHPMASLPTQHQHHTSSHPRPTPPNHHQHNHLTLMRLLVELMFQWTESRNKAKFSFPMYLMII